MKELSVELVETWSALETLSDEWEDLSAGLNDVSIFLTWEAVTAWRRAGNEPPLFVIAIRDHESNLVGLAPFYVARVSLFRFIPYRCLRLLGDSESGAEYQQILVREGFRAACFQAIFDFLNQNPGKWDCIWLCKLPSWTNSQIDFRAALSNQSPHRGISYYSRSIECAFLTLPTDSTSFWKAQSSSSRANKKRLENKMEKVGQVNVRACETETEQAIETLFELHQKRWRDKGRDGAFVRRPLLAKYFREFLPRALRKGWLRIYVLEIDQTPKAIQLGFCYGNRFLVIQEGYDPQMGSGAGNFLRAKVIEHCIDEGLQEYDFMEGYTEHKRRWGAKLRTGEDIFLFRSGLKTSVFRFLKFWPGGRFLRHTS